jgi:hypothetical protein
MTHETGAPTGRDRQGRGYYYRSQLAYPEAMVEGFGPAEAAATAHVRNLATRHGLDPDAGTLTITQIYGRLPRPLRPSPP